MFEYCCEEVQWILTDLLEFSDDLDSHRRGAHAAALGSPLRLAFSSPLCQAPRARMGGDGRGVPRLGRCLD